MTAVAAIYGISVFAAERGAESPAIRRGANRGQAGKKEDGNRHAGPGTSRPPIIHQMVFVARRPACYGRTISKSRFVGAALCGVATNGFPNQLLSRPMQRFAYPVGVGTSARAGFFAYAHQTIATPATKSTAKPATQSQVSG